MSDTSATRRERIKELFANTMSVGPAARATLLDEGCGGDGELRKAVEDLLANYESAQQFFAQFPKDFAHGFLSEHPALRTFSAGELVAGRFHIVGFLGAGGMGEVYEAEDLLLDRQRVALKTLAADVAFDSSAIVRLKRELALARQVTHLNVCRVFDVDQHISSSGAAVAFFTMELLAGETLTARLQHGEPLSSAVMRPLVGQMAAALDAAHAAGVVHGDFKPGNVMLVPAPGGGERVVVTDFGLARQASIDAATHSLNRSSVAWGTPLYMAPEQLAGRRPTRVTDVYALGAVVFEMVTGKHVVDVDLAAALDSIAMLEPSWRRALLRCLDHNPDRRFQNVGDLMKALGPGDARVATWRWAVALVCALLALLLSVPAGRKKLMATVVGTSSELLEAQQTVAILASVAGKPTTDGEAYARGLAATITDQLSSLSLYKPRLLFVPTAEVIATDARSPVRLHRSLGADVMVIIDVNRTTAQTSVTVDLHHASVQPTLVASRRMEMGGGDRIVPVVRTEVARMLSMQITQAAIPGWEVRGAMPAAAEQWFVRGRGYLEQGCGPRFDVGRIDLAIDAFQRVIDLDGEHAPARAGLSEALVCKYDATKDLHRDTQLLDRAEQSADEACRLQPMVAHCHVVRALTYLATGQHQRAIPSLEEALRIDPDAVGARESLANSYAATAQLARAEQTLEKAIAWHPQSWSAHEDLGVFQVDQGQYQKAETHFLAGRELAPDNPRVISNLAGLYTATELFDAAEQELLRAVKLVPDAFLYNNLGWAYFYQGDFPRGVDSMEKAVRLANNDSVVLSGLARGYRWTARQDDASRVRTAAIAAAQQQISANPRNVTVRANLAYLYAEAGDSGEASRQITRALEDAPDNVRVRFTSALVFEQMQQRQAALDALKSAIEAGHPKVQIAHHPDLRSLRTDDRYLQLIEHVSWKR